MATSDNSKCALLSTEQEQGPKPVYAQSPRVRSISTCESSKAACTYSLHDLSNSKSEALKNADLEACTKSVDNIYTAFNRKSTAKSPVDKRLKELANPMYRKDIFYSGSIPNLPEFQQSEDMETYVRKVTSVPDEDETGSGGDKGGCGSVCSKLKKTMDISLLADPVFLIYGISCFLCMAGMVYLKNISVHHSFGRARTEMSAIALKLDPRLIKI